jgi:tryptophan-rich sensory protein
LAGTGAAVTAAAVLGSVASAGANSPWFLALDKPVIQPPKTVFPIVWTLLYADIAISSAVAIDRLQVVDPSETVAFKRALVVNLGVEHLMELDLLQSGTPSACDHRGRRSGGEQY